MSNAINIYEVHRRPKCWCDDFYHSIHGFIIYEKSPDEGDLVFIKYSLIEALLPGSTIENYWIRGTEVIATQSKIEANLTC